jgi:hypothetical protein
MICSFFMKVSLSAQEYFARIARSFPSPGVQREVGDEGASENLIAGGAGSLPAQFDLKLKFQSYRPPSS